MNQIDVCLSPELIHLYDITGKIVVAVDILRASSCMTAGISNGVGSIRPFADLEACKAMKTQGYVIAGERNGQKVAGFDLGNSPYDYLQEHLNGKKIAVTTTNGTLAIEKSKNAKMVVIGSFLNKSTLANFLQKKGEDVLIFCAGWKGKFNLEDTLFAGAMVEALKGHFLPSCDAPLAAQALYKDAKKDLRAYLQNSSHVQRLQKLGIDRDIAYCLTEDQLNVIPALSGEEIIALDES
ncbi:2-phosphosulfolactate phosphatase [Fulvivirgaceae bacterium BMA12]|uniref:Probable 2-phosphosulfolactate phosphatase n=1 Tax=Agaribacillus aureus TaxID=3051825 RepID=A0ABT8LG97_9BACT|nr:2-phosphosulfolactate phosphatase [Fulvivirgaceae bacterium BMA12]